MCLLNDLHIGSNSTLIGPQFHAILFWLCFQFSSVANTILYHSKWSLTSIIDVFVQDFILFHNIDIKLFAILTTILCRDQYESMQVLALLIWLERVGFPNSIVKICSLPNHLINRLADEVVTCLLVITTIITMSNTLQCIGIPVMHSIMLNGLFL